jgi:maltose-binding protein MalE
MMSMSLNFGGTFITGSGDKTSLTFGANEKQIPQRIHDMIFNDKSLAPTTVGQSGADVLPGFFAGKYAMIVAGNYSSQQMVEQAPKDFKWIMLPMLKGTSQAQAANPQTMSIATQSKHPNEAMQFIAFYNNAENLARLAQGDWLIPATSSAAQLVTEQTKGQNGWAEMAGQGKNLTVAPFSSATPYPQWKTQIATPALQQYFGGQLTIDQLGQKFTEGWTQVAGG